VPRSFVVLALLAAAGLLVVFTVIGLAVLWPRGELNVAAAPFGAVKTERARVTGVRERPCRQTGFEGQRQRTCARVFIELESGPNEGERASFGTGDAALEIALDEGDKIRVFENRVPEGAQIGGVPVDRYALADFDRRGTLLALALGFAALVVVTGRLRGVRALLGLGISLVVVIEFIVPAILDGQPPLEVAIVGSLAIMIPTLALSHGFGPKTLAAALGTAAALLLTAALASTFTELANLTGFASDEAIVVRAALGDVSVRGLLLAGMVVGALGVLDDVTVSQSSTVMALQRANPAQTFRQLFSGALSVGRDHIAATVNTLVLAYVGASLPVLLIFSIGGTPFTDALNSEAVASEIVATLVGSTGLIAAVPVTTALAALLATHVPPAALADAHAGHAH
jgi:uncharacterized membrane protein